MIPEAAQAWFPYEKVYQEAWEWYYNWTPTDPAEQVEDKTMTWEKLAKRWKEMNVVCIVEEW